MMSEFPDYKKSIFKHQPTKVTLFGKKISRAEMDAENKRLKQVALAKKEELERMNENNSWMKI